MLKAGTRDIIPSRKRVMFLESSRSGRVWQKNCVRLVLKLFELIMEESTHHISLKAFSKMKASDMSIQFMSIQLGWSTFYSYLYAQPESIQAIEWHNTI